MPGGRVATSCVIWQLRVVICPEPGSCPHGEPGCRRASVGRSSELLSKSTRSADGGGKLSRNEGSSNGRNTKLVFSDSGISQENTKTQLGGGQEALTRGTISSRCMEGKLICPMAKAKYMALDNGRLSSLDTLADIRKNVHRYRSDEFEQQLG